MSPYGTISPTHPDAFGGFNRSLTFVGILPLAIAILVYLPLTPADQATTPFAAFLIPGATLMFVFALLEARSYRTYGLRGWATAAGATIGLTIALILSAATLL